MKSVLKNLGKHLFKGCMILIFTGVYYTEATAQIEYTYDGAGNRTKRKLYVGPPRSAASDTTSGPVEQDMKAAMEKGISVYPNPAADMVNVSVSSADIENKAIAYLMDNTGRVLFSKEVSASPFPIDLTTYRKGIYFIKVVVGKEQLFYKVIKSQ